MISADTLPETFFDGMIVRPEKAANWAMTSVIGAFSHAIVIRGCCDTCCAVTGLPADAGDVDTVVTRETMAFGTSTYSALGDTDGLASAGAGRPGRPTRQAAKPSPPSTAIRTSWRSFLTS